MNIIEALLPLNPYSRPGTAVKGPEKIVVHYVGNPGSTARNNRDYFANLAKTHYAHVSSHYVVGLEGEIIRCIPEEEVAYGASNKNQNTLHIECCHPDKTGKFTPATQEALVELLADICRRKGLDPLADVVRHYDLTGKHCPLWYVNNPGEWADLKERVQRVLNPPEDRPEILYRVQVGAFRVEENARRYARELVSKGYPAFVTESEVE